MAVAVNIDFDNVYEISPLTEDLRVSEFETILQNGDTLPLRIDISNEPHELIPTVYNFAFGPMNNRGHIDDKAELSHKDYSKVFSTILFAGLSYLSTYPNHYLGVDGSNNARAVFYYRFLQRNSGYLSQYFNMFGLKYYVRITRFGKQQYDNPFDFADINALPIRIQGETPLTGNDMYNYFIFNKIR